MPLDPTFSEEVGTLHGPVVCPHPCSECPDAEHHWIPDWTDEPGHPVAEYDAEHDTSHALGFWACKHCPAWSELEDVEDE